MPQWTGSPTIHVRKNTANQGRAWKMKRTTALCLACIMLFLMLPTTFAHAGVWEEPHYDEDDDVFLYILGNYLRQTEKEQREMDRRAAALYAQARIAESVRVAEEARRAEEALRSAERLIVCTKCGRQIFSDSSYCRYCGKAVYADSGKWCSWSEWSTQAVNSYTTREVEQRQILVGYNMFHYRTQFRGEPYWRVFRNFSVNGDFDALYSRHSYGEKYAERYVTASALAEATGVSPDSWNVYPGKGFQNGVTTAFDFHDDEYLWFIGNAVYETVYRYRDMKE